MYEFIRRKIRLPAYNYNHAHIGLGTEVNTLQWGCELVSDSTNTVKDYYLYACLHAVYDGRWNLHILNLLWC
jgi:hypothetical protein